MGSDAPARELLETILLHYSSFAYPVYLTLFGTKEVFEGDMCGVSFKSSSRVDLAEGDRLEVFTRETVSRKL